MCFHASESHLVPNGSEHDEVFKAEKRQHGYRLLMALIRTGTLAATYGPLA